MVVEFTLAGCWAVRGVRQLVVGWLRDKNFWLFEGVRLECNG